MMQTWGGCTVQDTIGRLPLSVSKGYEKSRLRTGAKMSIVIVARREAAELVPVFCFFGFGVLGIYMALGPRVGEGLE